MSYQEWIDNIEKLRHANDENIKSMMLQEDVNTNIKDMLQPKIIQLIEYKFKSTIDAILKSKDPMFYDYDLMDLNLMHLKKNIKFIEELLNIKYLDKENSKHLKEIIKLNLDKLYDSLIKASLEIDDIGELSMIIKNNIYKWSDENEL